MIDFIVMLNVDGTLSIEHIGKAHSLPATRIQSLVGAGDGPANYYAIVGSSDAGRGNTPNPWTSVLESIGFVTRAGLYGNAALMGLKDMKYVSKTLWNVTSVSPGLVGEIARHCPEVMEMASNVFKKTR